MEQSMDGLPKFANVQNERPRYQEPTFEIGPDGMALNLLQAVYRDPSIDLHVRMRAAAQCLPYESPRLGVSLVLDNQKDFGAILDRRIKRFQEMESGKLIEAKPVEPVEVKPPTPSINFRSLNLKRRI